MLGMHGSVYANYAMQVREILVNFALSGPARNARSPPPLFALWPQHNASALLPRIASLSVSPLLQQADVIIALGARFDDRVTGNLKKFAPKAVEAARARKGGIIHFEISPKNINKVGRRDACSWAPLLSTCYTLVLGAASAVSLEDCGTWECA